MPPVAPLAGGFCVLDARRLGVARFLLDAVRATEWAARRRNIELRCAWESRIGCVQIDELKMHHLLCILLLRAVERAVPAGIVVVTAEQLGDRVRFSICDAARVDVLDEVGDDRVESTQPWSAMEAAVIAHGGELWVESDEGARAMCCFTLLAALQASA